MGKLALAAKITHVPSMYLSNCREKITVVVRQPLMGILKLASVAAKWALTPLSYSTPTGW